MLIVPVLTFIKIMMWSCIVHNTKCIDFYNVHITHYHQRPLLLTEFCPTSKNCGPRLENMDLYSRLLVLNKNCRPVGRCKKIQSTYILASIIFQNCFSISWWINNWKHISIRTDKKVQKCGWERYKGETGDATHGILGFQKPGEHSSTIMNRHNHISFLAEQSITYTQRKKVVLVALTKTLPTIILWHPHPHWDDCKKFQFSTPHVPFS